MLILSGKTKRTQMTPTHHFMNINDFTLSYYEWGNKTGPVILLVHATGMHGRIWDQTIEHLDHNCRIIALESSGHGRSTFNGHILDWGTLGHDLKLFIEGLKINNIIGVGHSLGGHMLTQAAIAMPKTFKKIVLIDPVIFEPSRYSTKTAFEDGNPADNPMSKRRRLFDSWEDMYERYKERSPYSLWTPAVMRDYCRFAVQATETSTQMELCCNPETETSIYMGHFSRDLTTSLSKVDVPVTVMRGKVAALQRGDKIDFLASPTWPELATAFPQGKDVYLPELTHFIPMQDPALTARYISEK